ncbi:MAG: hypothetical protein M3R27_13275 [Bacteroidota bacterium]|nr:hypothetical protein [Bacteroidota bacterium]
MITVMVTYTVKADFIETNKRNIADFLEVFGQLPEKNFTYRVLLKNDGNTFVHLSSYKNKEIQDLILSVSAFLHFQKERDEKGLKTQPVIEFMEHIGGAHLAF